ncbi:MAG: SPOR domain-containing protein [Terracidiphilus sp.]
MQRGLGRGEFQEAEEQRVTEFTLGPAMLLGMALGLILVCGIFFWLGYAAGRRSPAQAISTSAQLTAGQPMTAQTGTSLSKPPAAGSIPAAAPPQEVGDVPSASSAEGTSGGNPLTSYAPLGNSPTAAAGEPQVRQAIPQQGNGAQAAGAPPQGNPQVRPALPQGPPLMVQVAAVSHQEDANVLVAALQRHGYSVTTRREPGDGLIHVQIGPFFSRTEALAMSQRLLGDGYNANVVP